MKGKQNVDEISFFFSGSGTVFGDDSSYETIDFGDKVGASHADILWVKVSEKGKVVGPVESAQEVVAFVGESPEFVSFIVGGIELVFLSKNRSHHATK